MEYAAASSRLYFVADGIWFATMSTDANAENNGSETEKDAEVVCAITHRVATPAGEHPLTVALVEVDDGLDLILSIPGKSQMSLDLATALYLMFHPEEQPAEEAAPLSVGSVLFTWHCRTCDQRAAQIFDGDVTAAEAIKSLRHQHEENSPDCTDSPGSFCVGSPTAPAFYPAPDAA